MLLAFLATSTPAKAQADSLFKFEDDPVAAMLDSLARLKYFGKPVKPAKSKFNYAPDSIPRFDYSVYEARMNKLDANSPFDLIYNPTVKPYIDLYTNRRRELVSRMLGLSQLYYPMFEEVLDRYGIPLELKHLAVIESALNPNARSKAGAMGLWQFMYATGKMFNLKASSYVDERCDPYKATVAAAEYLKYLYGLFGDWQMVLAAYNGGPGTVNKAIRRSGGKRTYWEIRPYLPKETQGYVPAFIAANYIMNYHGEHNIWPATPKKLFSDVDTINVKEQLTFNQISSVLGIAVEELQFLNPMYKRGVIPSPLTGTSTLVLPASKMGAFITNEVAIYNLLKKDTATAELVAAMDVMKTHTVKRGEHINTIARRYKCTVSEIKQWNRLRSSTLRPGQKLTVYTPAGDKPANAVAAEIKKTQPASSEVVKTEKKTLVADNSVKKFKYYTIRKGDTLYDIGRKHGMSVDQIRKLNNMNKSSKLLPGNKLKVGKA